MALTMRDPSSDYPPKAPESSFNVSEKSQIGEPSKGSKLQLPDGEINCLHLSIQGSLMVWDIRHRLRGASKSCERHAWSYALVEAAFYWGGWEICLSPFQG